MRIWRYVTNRLFSKINIGKADIFGMKMGKKFALVGAIFYFSFAVTVFYQALKINSLSGTITDEIIRSSYTNIFFALLGLTVAAMGLSLSYLLHSQETSIAMEFNYRDKIGRMVEYKKQIAEVDTEAGRNNLEYVLPQCRYDLEALWGIEGWVNKKLKEDLIYIAVDIINTAIIKDTCKNNKKEICKIIEICLKFAPNNKELEKIKKEYFSIYCTVS